MTAILEGRWADAERCAIRAGELGGQTSNQMAPLLITAQLGVARVEQDRGAEIEEAVRAFATRHAAMPAWRAALVLVLAQAGREAEARDELERHRGAATSPTSRSDTLWLPAMWLLARATSELGDARARPPALRAPRALRRTATRCRPRPRCSARWRSRWRRSPRTAGRPRRRARAPRAAAADRAAPRRPARARARGAPGGELRARRTRRAPVPLAAEAVARGEELGLEVLAARAQELLDRLDAPAAPAAAAPRFARQGREAVLRARATSGRWAPTGRSSGCATRRASSTSRSCSLGPGEELHALDLVAHAEGGAAIRARSPASAAGELSVRRGRPGGRRADARRRGQALLPRARDRAARRARGGRGVQRPRARRRGRARSSPGSPSSSAGAVGLGGRDRRTGSDAERARVNVTRAIRAALRRVGERDAELGRHLQDRCGRARSARTSPTRPSRSPGRSTHRGALRRGRRRQRVRRIRDRRAARAGRAKRPRPRARPGVPARQLPAHAVGVRAAPSGTRARPCTASTTSGPSIAWTRS